MVNKVHILFILFLVFSTNRLCAQYALVDNITTKDTIPPTDDIFTIGYEIVGDTMFQVRNTNSNGISNLIVTSYNIESGKIITKDTISGLSLSYVPRDITFNSEYIFFTDYSDFVHYRIGDISTIKISKKKYDVTNTLERPRYRNCQFLNDSIVLLSIVYNFHPISSYPGLHLSLYNVKTGQFVKTIHKSFRGVGIAHISRNWVSVLNDRICVVTPLSGLLYEYDFDLNLLKESQLNLFDKANANKNITFEKHIDSLFQSESARLNKIVQKYPIDKDYTHADKYRSYIHSKTYIRKIIDTVSRYFTYIERTFKVDDTTLGISISNKQNLNDIREFILYDVKNSIVQKKVTNWHYLPSSTFSKLEDMFPIDITRETNFTLFFDKQYIYTGSIYPPYLYADGTYKEVTEKVFKHIQKNGYVWTILKYKLSD